MNKYTLSFKSEKLEEEYQIFHQNNCVSTMRLLNLLSFVLCTIRTITFLIFNQMTGFIIFLIATFIVIIAQLCILNHKKELTDYYLLIMNIIIMFYQIYVEDDFQQQEAFVFGQNQMLIHAAMILISDFKFGALQIIANIAIKVAIAKYFQPSITFQTIFYSVAIGLMFMYSIYKINRKYRLSFLFTTQDTQYEQMIPLFTECPFALCTYNETNVQFKLKFTNFNNHKELNLHESNQDNLNDILRNYFIYGSTFESFLLTRSKVHDKLISNKLLELKHTSNHHKIVIRYSECWTTELMHIIIIDIKRQEILKLQQKINTIDKRMNRFKINIKSFLKNQMKILDKSLNNQQSTYQAITKLMYLLTKLKSLNTDQIIKLQFLQIFKKYAKLFQKAYDQQKVIFEFCHETKEMITVQNSIDELLIFFFSHLFKIKFQTINILVCNSFCQQNEFVDIIVKMDNYAEMYVNLQKDTQFRKILRIISPHDYVLLQDNNLTIRLYKNLNDVHQLYSYSVA